MFDYKKWREKLLTRVNELEAKGIHVSIHLGSDESPKPGYSVGLIGANAMGEFQNWITGETDYSVMPTALDGKMVSGRWGIIVSDQTFGYLFDEFVAEFWKHERAL